MTITQAIEAIRPTGGTAILDAIVNVSKSLQSAEGRRAIVLITDGYDEHSAATFDDALAAVKSAHATVYVVGIGGVAGISIKGDGSFVASPPKRAAAGSSRRGTSS